MALKIPAAYVLHGRVFLIIISCAEEGFEAISNPCNCLVDYNAETNVQRQFWGDLHGQNADTLETGALNKALGGTS